MVDILIGIIIIIAIEAVTEIIVDSDFPLIKKFKKIISDIAYPEDSVKFNRFFIIIHDLLSCGYCTSVWVSGFFSLWSPLYNYFDNLFICWIVSTFAFHRLSNWLHVIYELIRRGRVSTYDINLSYRRDTDGSS